MIAQIFLASGLFFVCLYAFTQRSKSKFVSYVVIFCSICGFYFLAFPEHTSLVANFVGVGRGVDLIFYVWIVISLVILLNLHFKLRSHMELITSLARKIAILEAEIKLSGLEK